MQATVGGLSVSVQRCREGLDLEWILAAPAADAAAACSGGPSP